MVVRVVWMVMTVSGNLSLCMKTGQAAFREGLGGDHRQPAIAWHSALHRCVTYGIGVKLGMVTADVQQNVSVSCVL